MLEKLYESISSEILTEDVKLQMSVLFESTVNEAIAAKEATLEEQNAQEIALFKESLTNQLGEYLDYFVEEFVQENEEIIDESVKINSATKVLASFDALVENFNVSISAEKIDEDTKIQELTEEINKLHNKIISIKKEKDLVERSAIVSECQFSLATDVEKDELLKLSETVEFDEMFDKKMQVFVEQIVAKRDQSTPPADKLDEGQNQDVPPVKTSSTLIDECLKYL